jgi:hypothetical protein
MPGMFQKTVRQKYTHWLKELVMKKRMENSATNLPFIFLKSPHPLQKEIYPLLFNTKRDQPARSFLTIYLTDHGMSNAFGSISVMISNMMEKAAKPDMGTK